MTEAIQDTNEPAVDAKIIKRYTNRKLYDTVESRYVTLDEIAEMVKQGAEVKIVDNRSKEDLTSVTLAQIIFEEEKKKNRMPLAVLREIIRHPSEMVSGFFQNEVSPRVASFREEAEHRIERLLKREGEDGVTTEGQATSVEPLPGENAADTHFRAQEMLKASQRTIEEWQRKLDERVKQVVENVVGNLPAMGRDFQAINEKLEALEKKLSELEKL